MPTSCVGVIFFVEFFCRDSENYSRSEGGDVEQVTQTSKHILVFVFSISQLNSTSLYLALLLLLNSYMLGIVLTLILIQESYRSTSTLIK